MSKNMVAIYLRVSTLDQVRDGFSLSSQGRTLQDWCTRNGYDVYKVYTDEGISGKDMDHRPAMQQLLADASDQKFNIVAFWALSRFTRSVSDLYSVLGKFGDWGITMYSHTESFDTATPFGRAMVGIVGVFAQLERELTSERVSASMLERAIQGKRTTGHVLGYEADGDGFKISEYEAEYVRYCYSKYLELKNFVDVAKCAKSAGYVGKRGRLPSPGGVYLILTRAIYCGYNLYNGTLYQGAHPNIISVDDFLRVQETRMRKNLKVGRKQLRETTVVSQMLELERAAGREHSFDLSLI